jgi:hypothetical protein
MSKWTVRQWCRMFKDGCANVHNEGRSGQPSIVMILSKVWPKKFVNDVALQISHPILYEIITVTLGHHKFSTRWLLKMLMNVHKMQTMALAFVDYFRVITQRWQSISQSHHASNRWWNLGFICECSNQRAVKGVDTNTFTKQAEKSVGKCCLSESWWQLFCGTGEVCWQWNSCYSYSFICILLIHTRLK